MTSWNANNSKIFTPIKFRLKDCIYGMQGSTRINDFFKSMYKYQIFIYWLKNLKQKTNKLFFLASDIGIKEKFLL